MNRQSAAVLEHFDFVKLREAMVREQIVPRGVRSRLVLDAMLKVPREVFVPERLREFAYDDAPLPIDAGQTISQPYIVAYMIEALGLEGGERVLEIGAGSGYAAAVLAQIAGEVYTVERIEPLAQKAASAIADVGYHNVFVMHGDGTRGWARHAPYDAIIVAAGGPDVPASLKEQLRVSGRLVMPVGKDPKVQELVRITRTSETEYVSEDLADVRFVPLVGEEGWESEAFTRKRAPRALAPTRRAPTEDAALAQAIRKEAHAFDDIATADLEPLLERIGDARIVLLGEATHGTSEFYTLRDRISRALIARKGFNFVAVEADWPDAARINHYVRRVQHEPPEWIAFARFPTWMWRNKEFRTFVDWLHDHNKDLPHKSRIAFHGLDLYSLNTSIRAVLDYLDSVDSDTARVARVRYGCLTPWQSDPATYGRAALTGHYRSCERDVMRMLEDLLRKRSEYEPQDGECYDDAMQNARLITNAERYYRIMYYGSRASWNLRDQHMFDTLESLLLRHGPDSKAIVWAHNSHIGDAAATEMSARGEHNIGQLCRERYGAAAYLVGFGTDRGTVAAASDWDAPMEILTVRPSREGSYERLCHETGTPGFFLGLGRGASRPVRDGLAKPRLERAIGVIYKPETELASHYFQAELPRQFDEYVWINETRAITPLATHTLKGLPETYPFGL
jgi:protein-L-isoaspartate(D-aspartate) O-methyltransferase